MRKRYWLAVVIAVAGAANTAFAQDVRYRITPRPAMPAPIVTASQVTQQSPPADMPPAGMPGDPSVMAPAGCAGGTCGATCGSQGPGKIRRVFDWLTYRPLVMKSQRRDARGYCHPPLYAFFPCEGGCGGCATCGGHGPATGMTAADPVMTTAAAPTPAPVPTTLYYTKAADAPVTETIAQTSFPGQTTATSSDAKASKPAEYHPTTYKPASIAKTMPVLPPTQFRGPGQKK